MSDQIQPKQIAPDGAVLGEALVYNGTSWAPGSVGSALSGNGSPEGVVTAGIGEEYIQIDGGQDSIRWLKQTPAGDTGWVPLQPVSASGKVTGNAGAPSFNYQRNCASVSYLAGVYTITTASPAAGEAGMFVSNNSDDAAGSAGATFDTERTGGTTWNVHVTGAAAPDDVNFIFEIRRVA